MSAESARSSRATNAAQAPARPTDRISAGVGWLPAIVLTSGLGLLVCSLADALSRATLAPSPLIYWAGILVIALPIFYRLTSDEASARERLGLVCLLGLALYGVKVVHDAPLFTFSDELVHAFNADQIAAHHHLFETNPILPVTPYYPGLESATSALMTMTGLSSFGAGVVIVGAGRLVSMAALFLLFARVGGSARIAGLAAAIYTANFNFLFWGAQYSYESLALPLLLLIVMAFAERETAPRAAMRAWRVPIVLAIAAVVITHHLTSYALTALLVALSVAYWHVRRTWKPPSPWPFALLTIAVASAWLIVVAGSTVGYLSPILGGALKAVVHTVGGESPPRALFHSESPAITSTPLAARAVSVLAILILIFGLPFGLRQVWRRFRSQPFALLFAVAALGFFATLALRLAPPAWETGNRASEFLFVGLAFVLACGLETWRPGGRPWPRRTLLTAGFGVVLIGGAIAGWPWDAQLSLPLRATAEDHEIVSPPLGVAEWAEENIPDGRFAAPVADARLLLAPGGEIALAGKSPDIEDILDETALVGWELPVLHRHHLRYVVVDRRLVSADGLRGYFFAIRGSRAADELRSRTVITKFGSVPGAARIYANGDIAVYDLGGAR